MEDRTRLWRATSGQEVAEPARGPLATNIINGMAWKADTIWLALDDAGIASLDVKTGAVHRYDKPTGINAVNQYAIASVDGGIAAIGGMNDFVFLKDGAGQWTSF